MLKNKITTLFTFILFTILIACKSQEKNTLVASTPSLFIKMQKTACYGTCPVYVVEIFSDGTVNFLGKQFVENIGKYTSKLSADDISILKSKILTIDFFNLQDTYDSEITDFPSCITEVILEGKTKKITNRHGGPAELKTLEKLIEEKVLKSNLIKSEQ